MAGMTTEMPNGCGACSGFWKWLKPPHKDKENTEKLLSGEGVKFALNV